MPSRGAALRVKRRLVSGRGLPYTRLGCAADTALAIVVFASVHHSDVIVHGTGEPYGRHPGADRGRHRDRGALILSIIPAGDGSLSLTCETVFSVIMVVRNDAFLSVQTIRHRDDFLSDCQDGANEADHGAPDERQVGESVALLPVALTAVVLLVLTFGARLVTFGGGRTIILPGFGHPALSATFVFMISVP